jgi:hypothetical protein
MLSEAKKQLAEKATQICIDVLNGKPPSNTLSRRDRRRISQLCMDYMVDLDRRFNQIIRLRSLKFDESELQSLLKNATQEFVKLKLTIEGLAYGLPDGVPSEERFAYRRLASTLQQGPLKREILQYMNDYI